jgi:ribosomal protein S12 methylthiotransferase
MEIQELISYDLNQKKIGKVFKVIIDRKEGNYWVGRSQYDSPEVDNEILIPDHFSLNIGSFYQVGITAAESFDLYAEPLVD